MFDFQLIEILFEIIWVGSHRLKSVHMVRDELVLTMVYTQVSIPGEFFSYNSHLNEKCLVWSVRVPLAQVAKEVLCLGPPAE
jgi:hypothetical protein